MFGINRPTTAFLLSTNIIAIVASIIFNWTFLGLLLIFWAQGMIIGLFQIIRITLAKKIVNLPNNKQMNQSTIDYKIFMIIFFAPAYYFFHFIIIGFFFFFAFIIYKVPVNQMISPNITSFETIMTTAFGTGWFFPILFIMLLFFINHLFSTIYYIIKKQTETNLTLIKEPFKRIFFMHAITIIGLFVAILLHPIGVNADFLLIIIFGLLKTIFDVKGHTKIHSIKQ